MYTYIQCMHNLNIIKDNKRGVFLKKKKKKKRENTASTPTKIYTGGCSLAKQISAVREEESAAARHVLDN